MSNWTSLRKKSLLIIFIFLLLIIIPLGYSLIPSGLAKNPFNDSSKKYVPGQVIVKFKPGTKGKDFARFFTSKDATLLRNLGFGYKLLKIPEGMSVEEAVLRWSLDNRVLLVSPDYPRYLSEKPNDPMLDGTTHESIWYRQWGLGKIIAPKAWDITTGSPSIIVAVIDTGVFWRHPLKEQNSDLTTDLENKIAINSTETIDGLDNDGNGYIDDRYGWNFN